METNEVIISNFVDAIKRRYSPSSPISKWLSKEAAEMLLKLATWNKK